MAWHNMTPSLTPLAVFDADSSLSSGALSDRSGLSVTLALNGQSVRAVAGDTITAQLRKAIIGAGARLQYSAPVSFPTTGLFIALVKPNATVVLNAQQAGGSQYLMAYDLALQRWYASSGGRVPVTTGDVWQVVAKWWDATNFRVFVNNNWADAALTFANRPSSLSGMIYDNGHNLGGALAAHGLFSGAATLADIQAIATELFASFNAGVLQGRGLSQQLALRCLNPRAHLGAPAARGMGARHGRRNIYFGGSGRIAGVVSIENVPGARKVRLFDKRTGALVREVWSNAAGQYEFAGVDASLEYFVVAHDHLRVHNAVVQDMLTP